METIFHDLRHAFRQILKTPGLAFIVVVTLALGIGANTAMFSVMSAVLLRYLPVRDPERLAFFHYTQVFSVTRCTSRVRPSRLSALLHLASRESSATRPRTSGSRSYLIMS